MLNYILFFHIKAAVLIEL